jgi:hypothetical protein
MIPAGTVERGGSISLSNETAASTPVLLSFLGVWGEMRQSQKAVDQRMINHFSLI